MHHVVQYLQTFLCAELLINCVTQRCYCPSDIQELYRLCYGDIWNLPHVEYSRLGSFLQRDRAVIDGFQTPESVYRCLAESPHVGEKVVQKLLCLQREPCGV